MHMATGSRDDSCANRCQNSLGLNANWGPHLYVLCTVGCSYHCTFGSHPNLNAKEPHYYNNLVIVHAFRNFLLFFSPFYYLFEGKVTEIFQFLNHSLNISNSCSSDKLEGRSQDYHAGFPCELKKPKYSGTALLLYQVRSQGAESEGCSWELALLWDAGIAGSRLTFCTTLPASGPSLEGVLY